jgi:hypothetical protein
MACFVQNNAISYTVHIKKKARNGAILNGTVGLLLPLDTRNRGKIFFSSFVFTDFSSSKASKRRRPRTPTCPKLSTCWRGGSIVATPSSFSPVFCLYKQGSTRAGGEHNKGEKRKGERRRKRGRTKSRKERK